MLFQTTASAANTTTNGPATATANRQHRPAKRDQSSQATTGQSPNMAMPAGRATTASPQSSAPAAARGALGRRAKSATTPAKAQISGTNKPSDRM